MHHLFQERMSDVTSVAGKYFCSGSTQTGCAFKMAKTIQTAHVELMNLVNSSTFCFFVSQKAIVWSTVQACVFHLSIKLLPKKSVQTFLGTYTAIEKCTTSFLNRWLGGRKSHLQGDYFYML